MTSRSSAVMALFLGAALLRPASAANVGSVQAPKGSGVTNTIVVAPVGSGGQSLNNGLGSADMKGALQGLTGVLPGLRLSKPDILGSLGLPNAKLGFRPDVAPPVLPGSAIPGAEAPQASYGTFNPAAPAVVAVQTISDSGIAPGRTQRLDLPDGGFKPGPGGGIKALDRQSVRLAAKAEAVQDQLKAVVMSGKAAAEEGAQGLGVRLMDILTDERNWGGSGSAKAPALGANAGPSGAPTRPGPRLLARGSAADGSGAASAWSYTVPGVDGGYWLAFRRPAEEGSGLPAGGLPAGVALIALQVSQESLMLSVVDAPARRIARRLAEDSAWALAEGVLPGAVVAVYAAAPELRDAVASVPSAPEAAPVVPSGQQVQAARTEVYAFLQSAGAEPEPAAAAESPRGDLGGGTPEQAPLTLPDPLVAASLLPILSLLILRSRLFS